MFSHLLLSFSLLHALASASPFAASEPDNSIAFTSLEKNMNSTSGSGNVAAAGKLTPFGDIGIGRLSFC
jgi:hypothetical protein